MRRALLPSVRLFCACAAWSLGGCASDQLIDDATQKSATSLSTPGLTAGYSFDEGSGLQAFDASLHAQTGTLQGACSWGLGKYQTALVLDGRDAHLALGDPAPLRVQGSLTISAWIRAVEHPWDDAAIVSKRSRLETGYQLDTTPDTGVRTLGWKLTSPSGGPMFRYGVTPLNTRTWYHVAGVYDAESQSLHVYVNGELDDGPLVGSVEASQQDSDQPVVIGQRAGAGDFGFQGSLDEVRIYARALRPAEIQADMNIGVNEGQAAFRVATSPGM